MELLFLHSFPQLLQRMAKDTFYFSHDFYSRNDRKLKRVKKKFKMAGIGVFWCLVEMMHEEGGRLQISDLEDISDELNCDTDMVESIISDFELFEKDEKFFWSESAKRRIDKRLDKSEKAKTSAKRRWEEEDKKRTQSESNANALHSQSDGNAIKKGKKESKEIKKEDSIVGIVDEVPAREQDVPKPTPPPTPEILPEEPIKKMPELLSDDLKKIANLAWADQSWREGMCMGLFITEENLTAWMYQFNASLTGEERSALSVSAYKKMLRGWIVKQQERGIKPPSKQNTQSKLTSAPLKPM